MKTITSTILLLLITGAWLHAQQPFILRVSPREQTISGNNASFTISVSAQLGFTASVYLTAASPTLAQSNISLSTPVIASPYTTTATLTVKPLPNGETSTHIIIIEGANGPALVRDTVTVRMREIPGWRLYTPENSPLSDEFIERVAVDRDGLAWINVDFDLFTFDGSRWTLMDTLHWPGSTNELIGLDGSSGIAFDSVGGTWATVSNSQGPGIAHLHQGVWSMHPFPKKNFFPGGIAVDGNGNIWIMTARQGDTALLKFDGTSWTAYSLPGFQGNIITVDSRNHIWLGKVGDDGIEEFDGVYWTHHDHLDPTRLFFRLKGLYADHDYHVWAIGYNGIAKLYGDSKVFYPNQKDRFPGPSPSAIAFDDDGGMWVANGYELHRFKDGAWQAYRDSIGHIAGGGGIVDLEIGPNNTIWLGTDDGLLILDGGSSVLSAPPIAPPRPVARLSLPHPNPASGRIALTIAIPTRAHARLMLLDELGHTVATPLDATLDPGDHEVTIPTDGIPAGAYFLQLRTASGTEMRPVAIVR